MKSKRSTRITEALSYFDEKDTWSLLLFVLYKLKDNPEWLTLSELSFLLDHEALIRFLKCFEGMTITIPKLVDVRLITKLLTAYQLVNFEEFTLQEALAELADDEFSAKELEAEYAKVAGIIAEYEFNN